MNLRNLLWASLLSLVALTARAETVVYVHTDVLGSPVLETDANAKVVRQVDYRAYGDEVLGAPRTGPGYTGHFRDESTGLVYMQQRYYDPAIGRFLSRDPVEADSRSDANFNRYWYANNNPYWYRDPDGRFAGPFIDAWRWITQATSEVSEPFSGSIDERTAGRLTLEAARSAPPIEGAIGLADGVRSEVKSQYDKTDLTVEIGGGRWDASIDLKTGQRSVGFSMVSDGGSEVGVFASREIASIGFDGAVSAPIEIQYRNMQCRIICAGIGVDYNPGGTIEIIGSIGLGGGERNTFTPSVVARIE